jgi:alpha-N-arabinofuranosidase
LRSPLLRYGGNFSSGYHWRDGVGPLDSRPTRLNAAWGIPEYNEFGTDEFMEFCRLVGALPQICLNMGSGTVQEARQWVEYCHGKPGSVEGQRRADNGHAEPYSVGAWEFGNELYDNTQLGGYSPAEYAARYLEFFRAVEPLLPAATPVLATGAELTGFEKWNDALFETAGPQLRYLTTHIVADLEDVRDRNADRNAVVAAGLGLPVGVGRALARMRAQMDAQPASHGRVKLAYSEWLFRSPPGSSLPNYDNMGGAVIAAGWLNMLAQNAGWIPIANMTGLVEFAGIHKIRGRVFVTPQYWVLNLYSKYAGDTVIETETRGPQYDVHGGQRFAPDIAGVPYLDVLGTAGPAQDNVSLFVVNRNPRNSEPATIRLNGMSLRPDVKMWTLTGHSLLDKNDEEHPDQVRTIESDDMINGTALEHVFPPASVTLIQLSTVQ